MKRVAVSVEDEILAGLVQEQLARMQLETGHENAGLVIAEAMTKESVPHLLLGGRPDDKSESLNLPFRLGDFTDRVRYMLSGRDRFAPGGIVEFAGCTLNSEDGAMTASDGRQVRLTDKEKQILISLSQAPDQSLDRVALLKAVWGYVESVETHTLETHLYRLRQKLEEGLGLTDIITTKDGIYTLGA